MTEQWFKLLVVNITTFGCLLAIAMGAVESIWWLLILGILGFCAGIKLIHDFIKEGRK